MPVIRASADNSTGVFSQLTVASGSNTVIATDANGGVRFPTRVGFFDRQPIGKPSITGSRGGNAAVANLLTSLANMGLITNNTTS